MTSLSHNKKDRSLTETIVKNKKCKKITRLVLYDKIMYYDITLVSSQRVGPSARARSLLFNPF